MVNPDQEQRPQWHEADDGCICCCTDGEHDGWKHPNILDTLNSLEETIANLTDRLTKTEAERDLVRAMLNHDHLGDMYFAMEARATRAEELAERLRRYVHHDRTCPAFSSIEGDCWCNLANVLADHAKQKEEAGG